MKDTSMGSRTQQKIDREVLYQMVLSAYSNMVLVRVPDFKEERKTEAGIILDINPDVQYLDGDGSHMADMERVVGIVEKVFPGLLPDGDLLAWHTKMELQVADTVYFDYYDSINSTSFVCDEDEYRLIPYASCYLARRNVEPHGDDAFWEETICLNGYCFFEDVFLPDDGFSPYPKLDLSKGLVYATGIPVDYWSDYWSDDIEIRPGDVVTFRKKYPRVYLERQKHLQTLGKRLFRAQRKDIEFSHGQNL